MAEKSKMDRLYEKVAEAGWSTEVLNQAQCLAQAPEGARAGIRHRRVFCVLRAWRANQVVEAEVSAQAVGEAVRVKDAVEEAWCRLFATVLGMPDLVQRPVHGALCEEHAYLAACPCPPPCEPVAIDSLPCQACYAKDWLELESLQEWGMGSPATIHAPEARFLDDLGVPWGAYVQFAVTRVFWREGEAFGCYPAWIPVRCSRDLEDCRESSPVPVFGPKGTDGRLDIPGLESEPPGA